jgi:type VI secretion system protein ImpL
MKWIIRLLKNRRLLIALVFILLIIGVLIGRLFWPALTTERQIFAIVVILFLWILAIMYERLLAVRDASMLEQAMKSQAEEQLLGMRPDKRAEIEELQQQFLTALDSLKKTKLGKGRSGKAALYALPWYMFIGPPAAGKTTAIANSGLEFPFGADSIKGVGGTRNCDWFFSNSAIILDTAGRYVTEEEDKEEWVSFLQMLKKHRRRQPVNGVIVGISIAELANMNSEELDYHAGAIRKRINELMQELGVRFPIYLVFTKCDLLNGFVNFFEDLNRREREQIWGCTFTSEEQRSPDTGGVFEKEFLRLVEVLIDRRMVRLSSPMKREDRHRVYVFPLQFSLVRRNLRDFVNKLFQPNPYQDNPVFRGFYFSSGTQEGVPIDQVIQALAAQYNLPAGTFDSSVEVERKSYFIRDLFSDIIIPDQNVAERTSRATKQKGLFRIGIFAAAVILLAAFIISVTHSYLRSRADLNKFTRMTGTLKKSDSGTYSEDYFKELETLRSQISGVEGPLFGWNIYQGDDIKKVARQLYYKKFRPFIENEIYRGELIRSFNTHNRQRTTPEARQHVINNLRAYLLLGDFYEKMRDSDEGLFLKNHLFEIAKNRLSGMSRGSDEESSGNMSNLVKQQIDYFIDIVVNEKIKPFENDQGMVEQARAELIEQPSLDGLYTQLKVNLRGNTEPYNLERALAGQYGDYFISDYEFPGIFTKDAREVFVKKEISKLSENPVTDDWVLGQKENVGNALGSPEEIEKGLTERYYKEYIDHWWQFLRSINFKPFASISEAARRFKDLSELVDSPIVLIIESVTKETRLEGSFASTVRQKAPGSLRNFLSDNPVDRSFFDLHELNNGESLGEIIGKFIDVSNALESLTIEPDNEVAEYTKRTLDGDGELPTTLKSVRKSLKLDRIVRKNLFEDPLLMAWRAILGVTQQYLNNAWRDRVYNQYQNTLASYYPFNANGTDAPVDDVINFFKGSGGTLENFLEDELYDYVDRRSFRSETWEGRGVQLSRAALSALKNAKAIRQGLGIEEGALAIDFSLQPELPEPQGDIDKITLIIDGKELTYQMGRPFWEDFIWPGQGIPGASLEVGGKGSTFRLYEEEGKWAWFKLLQQANFEPISSSEYWLRFRYQVKEVHQLTVNYRLRASSSKNPFRSKDFFNFKCPRQLN